MSTLSTQSPQNLYSTQDKDIKVSYFKNAKSTKKSKDIFISEYLALVSDQTKKAEAERLRALTIDEYKKAKLLKPCITGSCVMDADGRSLKNILFLNGLAVVDFDELSNDFKSWQELKEALESDPFTFIVHFSLSGRGLCVFVKIPKENNFEEIYHSFVEYYFLMFGANIDYLADTSRLRFIAFDPAPFLNEYSQVYKDTLKLEETTEPTPQDNDFSLNEFSNNPAIAFNNSGLAGLEIVNELLTDLGYNITRGKQPTIFDYQRAGGGLRSIVAFYNNDVVKFERHSPNTGLSKEHYNLFDLYTELSGFDLYTSQKELAGLGFGTFNEVQPIKANLQDINFRNKYRINVSEVIPPPQVALYINDEILGTLGNFSLITGKAKAKKSFLISMAVATALTDKLLHGILKSELPANQNQVLYFDTEQGKYHVQRAVKRICEQIGVTEPDNLHAFHLRSLTPSERLQFIEAEIYSNDNIGVVIIDGIKDLITSINDESEATMIASKLLKWTEERNIHILTVLHQNKGDNNARGHIGTELINKAETVLSVTVVEKDKEVSIVEAQQTRNREPQPFAFRIDENGIPFIISEYEATPVNNKISNVYRLQDVDLYGILSEAFKDEKSIKYAELVRKVKEAYSRQTNSVIGDNKAKDLISICKGHNFINQSAEKQPYTLLPFIEIAS